MRCSPALPDRCVTRGSWCHAAGFVPVVASTSPTSSICRSRRETPRSPPARRRHQSWRQHAIGSDRFVDELAASSQAAPRLLETVSGMTHLVGETTYELCIRATSELQRSYIRAT